MDKLFNVNGRIVLITGSSGGIGLALAQGLAERGAKVVLNGRRADVVQDECARLREMGLDAEGAAFDVTNPKAVFEAVERIERDIGAIDILFNNAGVQHRQPLEDFDHERWEELFKTNVSSVLDRKSVV